MALWILRLYSNCLGQANWGFLHSNYLKENHLTGIKREKKYCKSSYVRVVTTFAFFPRIISFREI